LATAIASKFLRHAAFLSRNEFALERILADLPQRASTALDTSSWLFNPGHSKKLICKVIVAAMNHRLPHQMAAGFNTSRRTLPDSSERISPIPAEPPRRADGPW